MAKLQISAKCSDLCFTKIAELNLFKDGYVPYGLGIGGGDYVDLTIDTETGKILGWKPLTDTQLKKALKEPSE